MDTGAPPRFVRARGTISGGTPGPAPQMATRSPSPTWPSSLACHAVGRMSDRKTYTSSRLPSGTFSRLTSAAGGQHGASAVALAPLHANAILLSMFRQFCCMAMHS